MRTVTAIVDRDRCQPKKCSLECIKYDPLNRSGGEGFHIGSSGKSEIAEEVVTEMHKVSAKMCPFSAIRIVKLPTELKHDPIHSYGLNQFRLFNIPQPTLGKVVGIIGVNGIGKSTAIKILASQLKPNLGKDHEASFHDIMQFFRGSETQLFFEHVQQGKIKAIYKPQQVDIIQKKAAGSVRDLLHKVDEKQQLDKIAAQLEITSILDRDIAAISGGEMQRVAIAATVLKDANFYIFDEPTSYLDIKQRLRLSSFIRNLATENTRIMVVEHDLIVLDYITDFVHVMFGEQAAFGVVSGIKSAKEGINVFLSGFLREENIRFRDHEIKFERLPVSEAKRKMVLCEWNDIKKTFDGFAVAAPRGEIYKGEIIGVLGENGIGKTTFVKMLAGVIKPDEGTISENAKVSYKPQYIEGESDELVMNILRDAIKNDTHLLIEPLAIAPLFMRKLNELSGGELQRVAIALALSRPAELFLLDEPSAYLDVEQRLIVSKLLKRFAEEKNATILVVDHDLLFLDYLSDRLLVFKGIPSRAGEAHGPVKMEEGMNLFLRDVGITFRRDKDSGRPRANKLDSFLDREQKRDGRYYYT
ncbi:MAG TPA: ribosome biogenesis/translation initiation ATPase RLI [Candidatus Nanoarchaeia archaeon]|nr:ribosome biogenesis/translation initiation ATPase RLI [Candidatus Nanoarchaeia archaeon]